MVIIIIQLLSATLVKCQIIINCVTLNEINFKKSDNCGHNKYTIIAHHDHFVLHFLFPFPEIHPNTPINCTNCSVSYHIEGVLKTNTTHDTPVKFHDLFLCIVFAFHSPEAKSIQYNTVQVRQVEPPFLEMPLQSVV